MTAFLFSVILIKNYPFIEVTVKKLRQSDQNPFPYSHTNKRYHTYDFYLRRTFGAKCRKIPLDGGFTCPNRDGSRGVGGCAFCSARGSGDFAASSALDIREQYECVRESLSSKWDDSAKNIPYFQAFTGTYAPLSVLREKYEAALTLPNVAALAIATRADCLEDELLTYLEELTARVPVVLELGLQSIHDATAEKMNRGHSFTEFIDGYERVRRLAPSVKICIHLIFGLPGEDKAMMLDSVRAVAKLRPDQVKLHLLHILRGTRLCDMFDAGEFKALTLEEYADTVVSALELLPPETVICRITGDGMPSELIAPDWSRKKFVVMNTIDKLLFERKTYQGRLYTKKYGGN